MSEISMPPNHFLVKAINTLTRQIPDSLPFHGVMFSSTLFGDWSFLGWDPANTFVTRDLMRA